MEESSTELLYGIDPRRLCQSLLAQQAFCQEQDYPSDFSPCEAPLTYPPRLNYLLRDGHFSA